MQTLFFMLELDGVLTSKRVEVPKDIDRHDFVKLNAYVRTHFESMGYTVGENIRQT